MFRYQRQLIKSLLNRSQKERSRIGHKIAETRHRNHTQEQLSLIAKQNASKVDKPELRKAIGKQIRNWWANMTPEYKKEYLARRGQKIKEAKSKCPPNPNNAKL